MMGDGIAAIPLFALTNPLLFSLRFCPLYLRLFPVLPPVLFCASSRRWLDVRLLRICVPEQRTQFSEQKSAHADLLVLLASQEIEKNTLMEHLGRHGAEYVQEAMKSAFDKGALDFSKLQR